MAADYDALPCPAKTEVQGSVDVNVTWLSKLPVAAKVALPEASETRAKAIYAAIAGASAFREGPLGPRAL